MTPVTTSNSLNLIQDIAHANLTTAITNSTLVPGQHYRITDYASVHTIPGTVSTNTPTAEPLTVLAIAANKLAPEAYSSAFPQDVIYYHVDNDQTAVPGCTKGYISRRIDTLKSNDIGFDYRNVKFRRWQIDVTTVDATGAVGNYAKGNAVKKTGTVEIYIKLNDDAAKLFTDTSSWKRFEWDNLQYVSPTIDVWNLIGDFFQVSIPCSALYMDYKMFSTVPTISGGESSYANIYRNVIKSNTSVINNINSVIFGNSFNDNTIGNFFFDNTIRNDLGSNVIGSAFIGNAIGSGFSNNTIGNSFTNNAIGSGFMSNAIGSDSMSNAIGSNSTNNTIGSSFNNNSIGSSFNANSIGSSFSYNNIGSNFYRNTIRNDFNNSFIGSGFNNNTIGANLFNSSIGINFKNNSIENNFSGNTIGDEFNNNSIGNNFSDNSIGTNFYYNAIGTNFSANSIGSSFNNNSIESNFVHNTIGNSFQYNSIGNSFSYSTIGSTCYHNTIGSGFSYNTTGSSFYYNTIRSNFNTNSIGNYFADNTIGSSFAENTIGNNFSNNFIGDYFSGFNTDAGLSIGNGFIGNTVVNLVDDALSLYIPSLALATHIYTNYNKIWFRDFSTNTIHVQFMSSGSLQLVSVNS